MEGRPAGERHVPEPPDPPHVTEMKARIDRDRALTRLFDNLSTVAELAADVAKELLAQAADERAEAAERRARHGR